MTNPIIFLDIDGVIHPFDSSDENVQYIPNLASTLAKRFDNPVIEQLGDPLVNQICFGFDKNACNYIEQLCLLYNARIVISSSWRIFHSLKELQAIFQLLSMHFVIDVCPSGYIRRDIIHQYIKTHQVSSYIVIDDMDLSKPFGFRFIQAPNTFGEDQFMKAKSALSCQTK